MNLNQYLKEMKEIHEQTYEHCLRTAEYTRMLAESLGKSSQELNDIYEAGLVHDIGKFGCMKYIKSNVNIKDLTDDERKDFKKALETHVKYADNYLKNMSGYKKIYSDAANYHHCYYSNPTKGYSPETTKGLSEVTPIRSALPEVAQLVAIADVYDALSDNKRAYREKPLSEKEIKEIMDKDLQNGHFNGSYYAKFWKDVVPQIKEMSESEKLRVRIKSDEKEAALNRFGIGNNNTPSQGYTNKMSGP